MSSLGPETCKTNGYVRWKDYWRWRHLGMMNYLFISWAACQAMKSAQSNITIKIVFDALVPWKCSLRSNDLTCCGPAYHSYQTSQSNPYTSILLWPAFVFSFQVSTMKSSRNSWRRDLGYDGRSAHRNEFCKFWSVLIWYVPTMPIRSLQLNWAFLKRWHVEHMLKLILATSPLLNDVNRKAVSIHNSSTGSLHLNSSRFSLCSPSGLVTLRCILRFSSRWLCGSLLWITPTMPGGYLCLYMTWSDKKSIIHHFTRSSLRVIV